MFSRFQIMHISYNHGRAVIFLQFKLFHATKLFFLSCSEQETFDWKANHNLLRLDACCVILRSACVLEAVFNIFFPVAVLFCLPETQRHSVQLLKLCIVYSLQLLKSREKLQIIFRFLFYNIFWIENTFLLGAYK